MPDLLTLTELKQARGESLSDTSNDVRYTWMLKSASTIIRNFSGRDFGAAQLTEERVFPYDGSGYLDIDDASAITDVKLVIPNSTDITLDSSWQWVAMPPRRDDSPVFWYIIIPVSGGNGIPFSPAMGFERNLDVYYSEHGFPILPQTAKVTGTWGWPVVPDDVKQAAIWTIEEWAGRDDGEALSAEAIAGYSRSWGRQGANSPALAIPDRARDVLASYAKLEV